MGWLLSAVGICCRSEASRVVSETLYLPGGNAGREAIGKGSNQFFCFGRRDDCHCKMIESRLSRLNRCIVASFFILGLFILFSQPPNWSGNDLKQSVKGSEQLHFRGQILFQTSLNKQRVSPKYPRSLLHLFPTSKDLIVYGAYFDNRARNGRNNVTLFLVGMNKTIWSNNLVVACGVGSSSTKDLRVRLLQESILMHTWLGEKKFPYDQCAIECYDLPAMNGSDAFVVYRVRNKYDVVVESLTPLIVPAPRMSPSGRRNLSVVTCTKAHDRHVAWLPEFIRYQKTLGVDHVHLSMLDTYIKDGGFRDQLAQDPFILRAIRGGYLTISVWNNWYLDDEFYVRGSIFQFLDCAYRFRGTYDYVFPLDSDDFFNPSIAGRSKLKDYIVDHCHSPSIGSCAFRWIFYYPDVCGMTGAVGEDGNVTNQLNSHKGVVEQLKSKSIHSTQAIVDFSFHDARCIHCLLPGYEVRTVRRKIAYVAHNRLYMGKSRSKFC